MYRRSASLLAALASVIAATGQQFNGVKDVVTARGYRIASAIRRLGRSKRYGAHADPEAFPPGLEREIVQATADRRARRALKMPQS